MIVGVERKYIFILLAIITTLSCKAQIAPIYNGPIDTPNGTYYKDVDNDYNVYEGEWKWEDGNNSLTISFDKRIMIPDGNDFQDFLIGAYIYVENGNELVNTFPFELDPNNIEENHINDLSITTLIKGYMPPCPECEEDVRYIKLSITDPNRPGLHAKACMVHFTDNDVEKIRMRIWNTDRDPSIIPPGYTGPTEITIPEGVYTFIKQD